jgi:hypothetical protein
MNVNLKCKFSLSKKLRSLLENEMTLMIQNVGDGTGKASISCSVPDEKLGELESLLMNETSIMITPFLIEDAIPRSDVVIGNIFSNEDINDIEDTPLSKIGATKAPERQEVSKAIQKEVEIPEAFSELKDKKCKNYIDDLNSFIESLNKSKVKDSGISQEDIEKIDNKRLKAVKQEEKNMAESLGVQTYVVNTKCASLALSDIDLEFPLNSPVNIGNISAKRLASSKELISSLNNGMLEFVSPDDIGNYIKEDAIQFGLETYGSVEEAEGSIGDETKNSQKTQQTPQKQQNNNEFKDEPEEIDILEDNEEDVDDSPVKTLSGSVKKFSNQGSVSNKRAHGNSSGNNSSNSQNTIRRAY